MHLIRKANNQISEQDKNIINREITNALLDKQWAAHINYNGVLNENTIVDIMYYIENNNDIIKQYEQQYEIFTIDKIIMNILYEKQQFILDTLNEINNDNSLLSFNKVYFNADSSLNNKGLELKTKFIEAIEDFVKYDLSDYININETSIDDIIVAISDEYDSDTLIDLFFINTNDFNISLNAEIQAFASDIINDYVINNYSNIIIELHKNDVDKKYIYGKLLINYLYDKLDYILPKIKFKQESNGTYQFSWLDMGKGQRDDADLVFNYISKDNNFQHEFLNTNNITDLKMTWPAFIKFVSKTLYNEALQLKVREYIVNLNDDILNERSKILIESNTATGSTYDIDFNPENDHERSKPIVIAKEFLDNGNTKNHVFFGEKGWNHGSVIRKYSEFLNTRCLNELHSPVIACAYLVGQVAFADPDRMYNGFDTIDEVITTLRQDPNIVKVYNLPANRHGGTITRLAKKWIF